MFKSVGYYKKLVDYLGGLETPLLEWLRDQDLSTVQETRARIEHLTQLRFEAEVRADLIAQELLGRRVEG